MQATLLLLIVLTFFAIVYCVDDNSVIIPDDVPEGVVVTAGVDTLESYAPDEFVVPNGEEGNEESTAVRVSVITLPLFSLLFLIVLYSKILYITSSCKR
jgi:hypothetical protein